MVFSSDSDSKQSAFNVGDLGSTSGLKRSPGGGCDNPCRCPCLENPSGQRKLVGYSHAESDKTEQPHILQYVFMVL